MDYLSKIHEKHEEWLNSGDEKVLVIDNTVPIKKEVIISRVSSWLARR